jgi:hypothetical protein
MIVLPLETKDIILQATLVEKDNSQPIAGEPVMWRKFNTPTQDWTTLVTTVTDNQGKTILPLYVQGQWTLIPLAGATSFDCFHPAMQYPAVVYLQSQSNTLEITPPKNPPSIPWKWIGVAAGIFAAGGLGYYFLVYRKKHRRPTYQPPPISTPTYTTVA